MKPMQYAKAAVAAVAAGAGTLATALADDHVTTGEWVAVAVAVLGALGITYAVPNAPATPTTDEVPGYRR
jgi:peptidoglycan/LPS O-acetylase OafA/YrhL